MINNLSDQNAVDSLGSDEALKFAFGQGIVVELIDAVIGWPERWVTSDGYRCYDGSASNGSFADYDVFTDEAFSGQRVLWLCAAGCTGQQFCGWRAHARIQGRL